MAQTRFTCTLTTTGKPVCQSYARVTIVDAGRASVRACPWHAARCAATAVLVMQLDAVHDGHKMRRVSVDY